MIYPRKSRTMLRRIDSILFGTFKNRYHRLLEDALSGCGSLLDVGCGPASSIAKFSRRVKYSVGVDAFQPSLEISEAARIHDGYRRMDIKGIDVEFSPSSFDGVIALDVIEHLEKQEGFRLIRAMELIARKVVVVFTPNGFVPQGEHGGNIHQAHLSGWQAKEMRDLGYSIAGISGWKPLRGQHAEIRHWPRLFWTRVSLLTQPWTERNPDRAFALLCVKHIDN